MLNRLRLYTVHIRPEGHGALERPVFVPEGFSVYAFVFGVVWALYQRCYFFAALILLVYFALAVLIQAQLLGEGAAMVAQLAIAFMVGAHANDMLRDRLKRQGYVMQDIASGTSLVGAQQRCFDRWVAA